MALGTVMIGLLPSYESIGVGASALLVAARLLQGFSAGGEWGSSTAFIVEWAPPQRRGLFGSLQQASVAGGFLLGSLTAASLSSWLSPANSKLGWRTACWRHARADWSVLRRNIEETPAFSYGKDARMWHRVHAVRLACGARAFGSLCCGRLRTHFLSYMPIFLQKPRAGRTHALWSNAGAAVLRCGAGCGRAVRSH
jgi:MHS family proline/betaine transporter-like MFS transporter